MVLEFTQSLRPNTNFKQNLGRYVLYVGKTKKVSRETFDKSLAIYSIHETFPNLC